MRFLIALVLVFALANAKRVTNTMWNSFSNHFNRDQKLYIQKQRMMSGLLGRVKDLEDQWYNQRVDHFDPTNTKTFKQLYYVNTKFFVKPTNGKKAIAFLYFNGEAPLTSAAIDGSTYIMELAKRYNAFVVAQEHRYYGRSFPVTDLSLENMKYLSTEQALEDAAEFQVYINNKYSLGEIGKDVTWVIIGGSYSGFLSTSYRIRYPHLVGAAWSSSGVVLPKDSFPEYFEAVATDYTWVPGCTEVFQNITSTIEKMWKTSSGRTELKNMFTICDTLSDADEADFWYFTSGAYASMAQYGESSVLCSIVQNTKDPLKAYSRIYRTLGKKYGDFKDGDCNDIHWINQEANTTLTLPYEGGRTWLWQTCSEFGWFQTMDKVDVWSKKIDINYYHNACDVMFKKGLRPNTDRVKYNYGALRPEGSNIVSIAGIADPWHPVCQLTTYKESEPVFYITGHDASHCSDMGVPSADDSPELVAGRAFVMKYLDEWLDYNK